MKKLMVALCACVCTLGAMADYTPTWRGLPKGYTQVEYVEANGTQYVDLGINAQSGLSLESDMLWTALPSDGGYCSAKSAAGQRIMLLWYDSNGWMFGYDNYFSTKVKASVNTLYHVESALRDGSQTATITDGDGNVVLDWANDPAATGELDLGVTLYLFANHNGTGVSGQTKSRCYALKIWRDNANGGRDLVGDFVPCKDDDGNTGLFNLVQNRFRAASKALTCGAVVYKPVDPSPYEGANVYVCSEPEGDWFVDENWSEGHVPAEGEDVVIADRTVSAAGPLAVKSLTIKEGGILKIQAEPAKTPTNLPSVFTDATVVTVAGELKVEYGARLRPICDKLTGAPVVFKVGSFTLDYGGRVWCDGAGYIWTKCDEKPEGAGESGGFYTYSPGWPTSYNLISSYGGKGQKDPYGYKYAPFLPGSQSSTYGADGGKGGGAFVLLSSGTVSLSGLVSCRSTDFGYCNGAGGGIWIVGSDFRVAPCAELVADSGAGGTGYGTNYAGTGGRISLAAGLMDYDIAALANGETPEDLTYTDSLDFITASANAGQGRVDPATAKRTTANRPGTITYVTRGEGTFVTVIPAPEPPPAPVYPDPAGDGQARTFVGEDGGDWDDAANWSPSGVPGNADAVTIDGKWVCASGIVHAASLTVNVGATLTVGGRLQDITAQQPFVESTGVGLKIAGDLTVAGDLSVGGADSPVPVLITVGGDATVKSGGRLAVYAANGYPANPYGRVRMATYDEATVFNVAGALTIDAGATVYPDADLRTGASVHFKASSILLAAGGTINADARGFGYAPINSLDTGTFLSDGGYGCTSTLGTYSPGSGGASYGQCGGYGGSAQGARYGFANAPFLPGGAGGYYNALIRGGGAVWLDAMQAELHGTITALGTANAFTASAGGGVWIVAKAFVSSPELVIQADAVRNGANGYSSYSAGGRIALGIALTEEEEAALLAGTTPETVTVVDGVVGFTATVLGETKSDVQKGNPGTVKTVTGSYVPDTSVTIVGSPKNAVSPAFSYGASIVTAGSAFALPSIDYGSDPDDPLVRYSYDGWVLTDEGGNEVDSGEGDVSFTVPQGNSTLTIRWTNVESGTLVSVPDATLGTVSVGGVSHDADFTYFITGSAAFTAVPASGAEFLYWVGEVPAGHQLDNPLTIAAGIGRRIQPVFRTAAEATVRAWTGAAGNGLWLDAANWSPEGVPGLNDTVTMAEGLAIVTNFLSVKTLALSGTARLFAGANIAANSTAEGTGSTHKPYVDPVIEEVAFEVETLTLADSAGFALGGQDEDNPSRKPRLAAESVNLSGASILVVTAGATNETDNFETGCGTVTVAGVFELADSAQFVPASDQYTGGSLVVRTGKFLLGEGAKVNAQARGFGYRRLKDPQMLAPGQGHDFNVGAGYGGKGGNANATYGKTYGFMYAPIHPGSCNGDSQPPVPGGGLIRIHAKSAVLNGTLDAKPGPSSHGGPSGGGIWVTTRGKMEIGATFAALAKGGTETVGFGGGGGGGRIAFGEWLTDAEVAQLAVDNEVPLRGAKQKPIPVLTEAEFEALHPGADIDVTGTSRGQSGTFVFLNGETKGFMLLVK